MKHDIKQEKHRHILCRGGTSHVGVVVVAHVVEEVVDVWKEVVVREVVVGVRGEEASSRVEALPKNLIASLPYRITRGGVPEAYCPVSRCTPEDGMGKTLAAAHCAEIVALRRGKQGLNHVLELFKFLKAYREYKNIF